MQAKHQVQVSQSQQAQVARLILQANLAYGESNSNGLSHIQRLKARHECRGYLNDALVLEPENAGALGLLGLGYLDLILGLHGTPREYSRNWEAAKVCSF